MNSSDVGDHNLLFHSWTGNAYCSKCGKPFCYVGDVPYGGVPYGGFPEGQEPYCTCHQEKPNYKITFPEPFKNIGWICPVCGRGVRPDLTSCPCNTEPCGMSA